MSTISTINNQRKINLSNLHGKEMETQTQTDIEAAVFRRLISHLDSRKDVQNIDLMNLSGFCRNCLAKWYSAEARDRGEEISVDSAKEIVYGMTYVEWKQNFQK